MSKHRPPKLYLVKDKSCVKNKSASAGIAEKIRNFVFSFRFKEYIFYFFLVLSALLGFAAVKNCGLCVPGVLYKNAVIAETGKISSYDPGNIRTACEARILSTVFETLVRAEGGEIKPGLADSWQFSENKKKWIFHLRRGVVFHDGTRLCAENAAASFLRMWYLAENGKVKSCRPEYPFCSVFLGGKTPVLESVAALDDYRLEFTLRRSAADFLSVMASAPMAVALIGSKTAENVDNDEITRYDAPEELPLGTGPFKFIEQCRRERLSLERFDNYWSQKPFFKNIVFLFADEHDVRLREFLNKNADIASGIFPHDIKKLENCGFAELQLLNTWQRIYLAFNCEVFPFKDVRLRKAADMALNIEELLPPAVRKEALLSPFIKNSEKQFRRSQDMNKAARMWKRGVRNKETKVSLIADSGDSADFSAVKTAEAAAAQFRSCDIKAEVYSLNSEDFQNALKTGCFDMAVNFSEIPSMPAYMGISAVLGNDEGRSVMDGSCRYKSRRVFDLLNTGRFSSESSVRRDLYLQALNRVYEDTPYIDLAWIKEFFVYNKRIKGLYADNFGIIHYERAYWE